MGKIVHTFDANVERYDRWFDEHYRIYQSEVSALEQFVPRKGMGLEIGIGTGRFAAPLHLALGIDPSLRMVQRAHERGVEVILARGESLPFCSSRFDFVLMVTVICFLHDPLQVMEECWRVLRSGGVLILAFIDRDSPLGEEYRKDRDMKLFFKDAAFYTVTEIRSFLNGAGFPCEEAIPVAFEDYGMVPSGFVIVRALKQ